MKITKKMTLLIMYMALASTVAIKHVEAATYSNPGVLDPCKRPSGPHPAGCSNISALQSLQPWLLEIS